MKAKQLNNVFESIESLVSYVEANESKGFGRNQGKEEGRKDFFGTKNWQEQKELTEKGWPEGARRIEQLRAQHDEILSTLKGKAQQVSYSVAGGQWIDIGRHLGGEPECFGLISEVDAAVDGTVVRIDCNVAASGRVTQEQFFQRGAAACVLADLLETAGKRVEIWGVWATSDSYRPSKTTPFSQCRVLLKRAEEPLDLTRVGACLAHPGFFRRFGFGQFNVEGFNSHTSYPAPFDYTLDPNYGKEPGVVAITELHSGDFSKASFGRWLEGQLAKAGIKVSGFGDEPFAD